MYEPTFSSAESVVKVPLAVRLRSQAVTRTRGLTTRSELPTRIFELRIDEAISMKVEQAGRPAMPYLAMEYSPVEGVVRLTGETACDLVVSVRKLRFSVEETEDGGPVILETKLFGSTWTDVPDWSG